MVYQQDEETITALKAWCQVVFSAGARWHYYSMAGKTFGLFTRGSAAEKILLRAASAVMRWVEAGKGVPPMRFAELLAGRNIDAPLREK